MSIDFSNPQIRSQSTYLMPKNTMLPNWRFNADANTGHGFAIFMASVGALRASRSGAG
jgi:hypothetical protein